MGDCAGMTLLELLLSLALTGVVMVVISMAIHLHLFTLGTRRADVEQALLARSVLRRMAADIRNAVWYEPLEMSSLVGPAATSAGSVAGGDATDGTGGSGSGNTGGRDSGSTGGRASGSNSGNTSGSGAGDASSLDFSSDLDPGSMASQNTGDIAGTVAPASVPGLYGNQYELSIDCSRLPRVDQYAGMTDATTGAVSIPSDVKTVSYFLRTEDSAATGTLAADGSSSNGLVRREMDRAAASWASQDGSLDPSQQPGGVLAPEVTYLEFRYFDGTTWYTEWDSEQMGGLPTAIEITISIDPAFGQNEADMDVRTANELAAGVANLNKQLYRLVVHLPIAQPLTAEYTLETTDGASETSRDAAGDSSSSTEQAAQGAMGP